MVRRRYIPDSRQRQKSYAAFAASIRLNACSSLEPGGTYHDLTPCGMPRYPWRRGPAPDEAARENDVRRDCLVQSFDDLCGTTRPRRHTLSA